MDSFAGAWLNIGLEKIYMYIKYTHARVGGGGGEGGDERKIATKKSNEWGDGNSEGCDAGKDKYHRVIFHSPMGRNGPAYLRTTNIPNAIHANAGPMNNPKTSIVVYTTSQQRHRSPPPTTPPSTMPRMRAGRGAYNGNTRMRTIALTMTIDASIDQNGNATTHLESASRFALSSGACRIIAFLAARWNVIAISNTITDDDRSNAVNRPPPPAPPPPIPTAARIECPQMANVT
jgi:hypothetical protein